MANFHKLFVTNTVKKFSHQKSNFKARMHQIRFRLGLQCSPRPLCWI